MTSSDLLGRRELVALHGRARRVGVAAGRNRRVGYLLRPHVAARSALERVDVVDDARELQPPHEVG